MERNSTNNPGLISLLLRLTIGQDLEQARNRMRNAWVIGFAWAALSFIGAIAGIWGLAPGTEDRVRLGLFIYALIEVGLVAYLSYGVLQRRRIPATLLFFYFWISRIFWISFGVVGLSSSGDIVRFFILAVLPAYIFLQGMRGAWTYFYLTHPGYPTGQPPDRISEESLN